MGLRDWTAEGIREGGTAAWFLGMAIKLGMESFLAGVMGYGLMNLLWWWLDIGVFQIFLGGATKQVVWIGVTLGLVKIVSCRFTKPLITDQ
jgi:hypothetical protein